MAIYEGLREACKKPIIDKIFLPVALTSAKLIRIGLKHFNPVR